MDCREAKTSLADLSAEQLTPDMQKQIEAHFADCPPCLEEWRLFQATLFTVSQTTQPMPSSQQSREMWLACEKSWMERVERERHGSSAWNSFSRWIGVQPAWGWASLGGALAVLGGVWIMTGAPEANPVAPAAPDTFQMIRFEQPPSSASPLLNHHSVMAFDPFEDHVATTLVSYSDPSSNAASTRVGRP
jgi:hypothetical protein